MDSSLMDDPLTKIVGGWVALAALFHCVAMLRVIPNRPTNKMVSSTNLVSSCHDSKKIFMQIFFQSQSSHEMGGQVSLCWFHPLIISMRPRSPQYYAECTGEIFLICLPKIQIMLHISSTSISFRTT